MSGSHLSVIVMPIVIAIALASWLSAVYWAGAHPGRKHQSRPPRSEVAGGAFEANAGGRQLMPIWGERPAAVPGPRSAAAAENYQPGDLRPGEEAKSGSEAQAAEDARPAGVGLPPR